MSYETLAIIFGTIALGSFAKGLTGIGLPLISIPVLAGFLGVEHAIVTMTIPVAASNIWIVWAYRRHAGSIPGLPVVLGCAMVGAIVGTYVLATLDDEILVLALIAWIGLYLVNFWLNPDFRLQGRAAKWGSPVLAAIAGVSQGAMGMSGPVIATWIHSYRLQAQAYVFAVSALFLAISATHVLAVAGAGLMDRTRFIEGLLALIPMAMFLPVGMRMSRHIGARTFNRLIIGLVVVMEIKLIWQRFFDG